MGKLSHTVSAIYEAFGKGDVPAILSHLSNDVQWEDWIDNSAQKAGVPWLKKRQGKNEVPEFFKTVGEMQFKKFEVLSLMEGEDQVAAEIVLDADIPANGSQLMDEEVHLWKFNEEGKVIRMRHYADTAKHIKASQVAPAIT